MIERTNTLIVGGGQAGLAMSEHLHNNKIDHIIVERVRIVERWRSCRWDSLSGKRSLLGMIRFPTYGIF